MPVEWVLAAWTAAGWIWWLISLRLVIQAKRQIEAIPPLDPGGIPFVSIFKPLPPLGVEGLADLEKGLMSFVVQLDERSELLLGVQEADRGRLALFLEKIATRFPAAKVKVMARETPDHHANPKISWQEVLAGAAEGELWLWSDADIVAPGGLVAALRAEFLEQDGMLTVPYVVAETKTTPSLLDALFVNAELYPGILFLRARGPVDFGLGAAMLFRREDFLRKVNWQELGAYLADDFYLGQKLKPVRLSTHRLVTVAAEKTWLSAVRHYFRWHKTIRWNRPLGVASRLLVMPLAGWTSMLFLRPSHAWVWVGWAIVWQIDVAAAAILCLLAGCSLRWSYLPFIEGWAWGRLFVWVACWLPGPVRWGSTRWEGPRKIIAED
jgi:ceramide glucosyltransferase